jgi:sulfate adenylyltransferase
LITPHGAELALNAAEGHERAELHEPTKSLPQLRVGSRHAADLKMLVIGAYSPLSGFMNRIDYLCVVKDMHLANGLPWTIPM